VADPQVFARIVDRGEGLVEGQIAVFQRLQLLVEQLEGAFVRQLVAQGRTSRTWAERAPSARRTWISRSGAVSEADRSRRPRSSSVML
jgi:hypothetical protein